MRLLRSLIAVFVGLFAFTASAQRFVKTANTIADMVAMPVGDVHTNCFVRGYLTANDGGGGDFMYSPTSVLATNRGTVFAGATGTGRWLRQYVGEVELTWFGAVGDGTTDNTAIIANAASIAVNSTRGGVLRIPAGNFKHTGITALSHLSIIGVGRDLTTLSYSGTGSAVSKTGSAAVTQFKMSGLTIKQILDGNGGIGLDLDSFQQSEFSDVLITKFRNAGDTGIGIRLLDTHAGCYNNTFFGCQIDDSDTALLVDSSNATFTTGYNKFYSLYINQEKDCVKLLSTLANGSKYNSFYGLSIQGNSGAGDYITIEGSGNEILGITMDATGPGLDINLTAASSRNNLSVLTGVSYAVGKYVDNGTSNDIKGGFDTHTPGHLAYFSDPVGLLEASFQSAGNNATAIHIGNAGAGSQAFKLTLQASATPYLRLNEAGNVITEWDATYTKFFVSSSEKMRMTSDGLIIAPSGVAASTDPSAALELVSTNKSFVPPRMTIAARNNIATPLDGSLIYQTDSDVGLHERRAGAWVLLGSASAAAPVGSSFVTAAADATLTGERVLTGTVNQITFQDNGANSTIVGSLPQDIAHQSAVVFTNVTTRSLIHYQSPGVLALQTHAAGRITIGGSAGGIGLLTLDGGGGSVAYPQLTLAAQTLQGTPVVGSVEYDGSKFYATPSGTASTNRHQIATVLIGTATLDYDLTAVASEDKTVTVTGAAVGDTVAIGVPNGSVTADTLFWGWVSAGDTVTIRAMRTAGTPNPGSGTFKATVIKN